MFSINCNLVDIRYSCFNQYRYICFPSLNEHNLLFLIPIPAKKWTGSDPTLQRIGLPLLSIWICNKSSSYPNISVTISGLNFPRGKVLEYINTTLYFSFPWRKVLEYINTRLSRFFWSEQMLKRSSPQL